MHRSLLLLAGLLPLGCQSGSPGSPPSPAGIPVESRAEWFFGSPIGGPAQTLAASAQVGVPWTLEVEAFAMPGPSEAGGEALTPRVSMVADPRRFNPILPAARVLARGRWYDPATEWKHADRSPVRTERVALYAGQCFRLVMQAEGLPYEIALHVQRTQGAARGFFLTLSAREDQVPIEFLQLAEPWSPETGAVAIVLDLGEAQTTTLGVVLRPWNPAPGDPEFDAAKTRSRTQDSTQAAFSLTLPDRTEPQSRFLAEAVDRLRQGPDRSILYSIASEVQAPHAQDWILICTDDQLANLIGELGKGTGRRVLSDQPGRLSRNLEACSLRQAARSLQTESLRDVALAYLIRQAGQLAFYPDVLVELVERAETTAELNARLAAENRIFLEDSGRSARLRAFEWLQTQGLEPKGYDPLSRSSQRQAALDRWREALDQGTSQ